MEFKNISSTIHPINSKVSSVDEVSIEYTYADIFAILPKTKESLYDDTGLVDENIIDTGEQINKELQEPIKNNADYYVKIK